MKKGKLYCFYTPSHEKMFKEWLEPGAKKEYQINAIAFDQQLSDSGEYRLAGWRETQYNKVLYWIEAVKENMGEVIVCSDVDVNFLKPSYNYFKELLHSDDIAFQTNRDDGSDRICSGFFLCRCSLQTQNFFEVVAKRLKAIMHEPGGGEQYVMEDLINEGWLQLKIKMIPRDKVWNPGRKYEKVEDLDVPESVMVHHANWAEGDEIKINQLEYVKSKLAPYAAFESTGAKKPEVEEGKDQAGVALCLSSLLRYMDLSAESIIRNVIHTLPEKPDLFGHFPSQSKTDFNLKYLKLIEEECNQSFVTFEDDEINEEYLNYSVNLNSFQRHGVRGNLLQWVSMKKCLQMKIDEEEARGQKYKCVIWTRPDLYYFNSLENINNLNGYQLYIPAHDNHLCGLFDRFSLGTSEVMDARMNIFDYFTQVWYPKYHKDETKLFLNKRKKRYQWNPEIVLKELIHGELVLEPGKLNLCSGKIRDGGFVKVPFWHEIHGNPISGKACEEDIVNPEILRKTYSYENIKTDKYGGWFEVKV